MTKANDTQIGGDHYKTSALPCPHCGKPIEHWDVAWGLRWNNFVYAITKYLWRNKAGVEDLEKASHVISKYIEVIENAVPQVSEDC